VSDSLRNKAVSLGIADQHKLVVLASGSSNGVDTDRFALSPERLRQAASLRRELKIPQNAPVVGFVGRLTRDKGLGELIDAYLSLRHHHPDLHLLLVGEFEEDDSVPIEVRKAIEDNSQIVRTGTVLDPAPYYHVMDMLALPTHREGFPNVVLEAQAASKPVVTTRATGAVDSVRDGITGFQVPVGDVESLTSALSQLIQHPEMARQIGRRGYERVQQEFRQDVVWKAWEREFVSLLKDKGLQAPPARDSNPALKSPVNLTLQ
jgi:glycosyltransferase involved in cell wall biosynthesis